MQQVVSAKGWKKWQLVLLSSAFLLVASAKQVCQTQFVTSISAARAKEV